MTTIDNDLDRTAAGIRELRERLLESGFRHSRITGELVRVDDHGVSLYVRTGYTHGAYRLTLFGRRNGERAGQCHVDVTDAWSAEDVDSLTQVLVHLNSDNWPPHQVFTPAQTGWGDGRPA